MDSNSSAQGEQFTAAEACSLFERHTGFVFHPTVPGQLMARLGFGKTKTGARPATYHAEHWKALWREMLRLALERCKCDSSLAPPIRVHVASIHAARVMYPTRVSPKTGPRPGTAASPVETAAGGAAKAKSDLQPHPKRCFIKVPFAEKDEAKALGARWDAAFRMWYIPNGLSRKRFRWPDELMPRFMRMVEPMEDLPHPASAKKMVRPAAKRNTGKAVAPHERTSSSGASWRLAKEMDDRLEYLIGSDLRPAKR